MTPSSGSVVLRVGSIAAVDSISASSMHVSKRRYEEV